MPMLGDLLSSARRSAADVEQWLAAADHQLFLRIAEAAAAEGMSVRGYVRMAVAEFGQFATEEDWATLVSCLRDSGAPGATCLTTMLQWRLALADMTTETAPPREEENGHV